VKRILIIGVGGSGKSTLANLLGDKLQLPVIHLDQYYWKPGWIATNKAEWSKIVNRLIQKDKWIIDGNYGGTMKERIEQADTIIFLYRPTLVCLFRVLSRTFRYFGETRPDMTENCPEKISWDFYHYILVYNFTRAPKILKVLNQLKDEKQVIILKKDKAVKNFLLSIKSISNRKKLGDN